MISDVIKLQLTINNASHMAELFLKEDRQTDRSVCNNICITDRLPSIFVLSGSDSH